MKAFRAFPLLVVVCFLFSQHLSAQLVYDGAILDRVGKWDSYPSHLNYLDSLSYSGNYYI